MAGSSDERKPAFSSSPRDQKFWVPRAPGRESPSERRKEDPRSSSPSVSSKKTPQQMVTPVQPPKSVDSLLQMVTPVQPLEFLDLPLQLGALSRRPESLDSRSTSCGSGAVVSDSGAAPFDICRGDSKCFLQVKPSLLEINREKRRARELSKSAAALQNLRPGMVLLKNFLKPEDQIKIIKQCREIGVGTGGFYQPGYRDGAKTSLHMMCLGKNWDPDSCSYRDIQPFIGAQPPKIPEELTKFIKDAIEASHAFLKQSGQETSKPSKEIPPMSPDICIVNFYTNAGKLGLHQDKDERKDSLAMKLPVVSFSLGDTAEFLYGDGRDETKASKINLESGDVLIFGGQSRHIFHGVSSITPKTAPTYVTKEANLRPGHLNLTFRQYKAVCDATPTPFDIRMCDNDAAPLKHLRPGIVLLKNLLTSNDQGPERSSECHKEGQRSSAPSFSSKKSLPQMVTPVQPPKSLDSAPQMVTPVQLLKSVNSPPQMVTPVQPPESLDLPLQLSALFQIPKSVDTRSTSYGSGALVSDSGSAPFDICRVDSKCFVGVKPSLFEINKEKRRARELSKSAAALQHLRPGMVLLKNFLKPEDQVKIIKHCRELGVGRGGFYQPGYRDGAKSSLRMMCLGKNWDPDSCLYRDIRPFDGAQPPKIPEELTKFIKDAIEASHAFLKQSGQGTSKPSKEIPPMSPDICIVNFYTTAGKLGLHQDKDETKDSLAMKLPVVSFSLGDTAEFLYGDGRDETKASKINLESGDVLIFGGQSRHIFHGVSSITPKTAPTYVTKEANLRPGRLNLTFRQYKVGGEATPGPCDICMCDNDAAPLKHLRPGMVLLKKFLTSNDQVEIIALCQHLGVDTGVFNTPSSSPQTMSLGKKWTPYSSSFGDMRPFDGAQQPDIPEKFMKFVEDAIEASHEFLEQRGGTSNPLVELPSMSPDACTVSLYTSIGRSGLHQDKDVTKASLTRELPIVSFSLGNTTEFLYRDARDDEPSKIDLESGDVLIFGGQSRRIFQASNLELHPSGSPTGQIFELGV